EPFGSLLPGRNYSSDSYRFGFDTQEQDNEIYGAPSTSMTAEYWQYDTRTARRWNLDPIDQISISNYAVFGLNPILNVDHNGAWFWESKNIRQGRQFARATGGEFSKSNGNAFVDVSSLEGNNTGGAVSFRFMKGQDRGDLLSSVGVDFRDRMAATTSGWDSFKWSAKSLDYATQPGHTPPAALQALIGLNPVVAAGNLYSGLSSSSDVYGEPQSGLSTAINGASLLPVGYMLKAVQGGRVFWTGGNTIAGAEARAFAGAQGLKTLDMTGTGKVLTQMEKVLPASVMNPLWDAASARFAWGAQGPVHLFYNRAWGIGPKTTWSRIEKGILEGTNSIHMHPVSP
ncbi:MAG TPA: hypothetical protein PKJ19_08095, partial [Flavobacteriales bacterium]|nr:hypothetical protein [Flavobacteriales bacterium]